MPGMSDMTAPKPGDGMSGNNYLPLMKAGGLRNGAERGGGSVFHAVPEAGHDTRKALCGTAPRIMWSGFVGEAVNCPRCSRKLSREDS